MKAVRYHQYGDVNVLRYEDVDVPVPQQGQILIRVTATSFNPIDAALRAGHLQQIFPVTFPHTPGIDVAGRVMQLGDGVTGFDLADPVIGILPMTSNGAAAEYALAPADALVCAPTGIPLADAAALPGVGTTAWQALFEHADLKAGQRILINGGGGAVGGYAVQLAKQAQAFVVATAGPLSQQRIHAYGADQVIDHTTARVPDTVTEPVDVVLHLAPTPEDDLTNLINLIRPGGILVSTTTSVPADPERGVRTVRMNVHTDAAQLAGLVDHVNAGHLHVAVAERYPLEETALAHEQHAAGKLPGKVLLIPPN